MILIGRREKTRGGHDKWEDTNKIHTYIHTYSSGYPYLTLLGPQFRFGDKILIIGVFCPHIWECGAKGVKSAKDKSIWDLKRGQIGMSRLLSYRLYTGHYT